MLDEGCLETRSFYALDTALCLAMLLHQGCSEECSRQYNMALDGRYDSIGPWRGDRERAHREIAYMTSGKSFSPSTFQAVIIWSGVLHPLLLRVVNSAFQEHDPNSVEEQRTDQSLFRICLPATGRTGNGGSPEVPSALRFSHVCRMTQ